jgi:pimeloyl-ACP methyl ester carboxylesterase
MTVIATDHWITTDRGKLFARRWTPTDPHCASRASILLLHDSLGCVKLWRDFPEKLARATHRSVVAYDRLGFGESSPHPGTLPLTFIDDEGLSIVPLIRETLELGAIIPFGYSVGGGMAIAAAAHLTQRCAALITESAQSFVEDRTYAGLRAAQDEFERPGELERLARYHGSKARWVLDAWINTWLSPAFAEWNLDVHLKAVRCPALVIHGDQDEYGSVEHPGRIARLVSARSRIVILQRCGHVPHREHPAQVLDEVKQFLASVA